MGKGNLLELPISGRVRQCLSLINNEKIKGKKVLDIGSSFGWLEYQLKGSGAILTGIEPNKEALEFASKNVKEAKFVFGSAIKIPFKDNEFDAVFFFDVLEHIPKGMEKEAFAEINRVLKKGGVLLMSTPNNHLLVNLLDPAWYFGHRHYSYKKLESLLLKSGFKIISAEIKGGLISAIYLLWFYFAKWILKNHQPKNKLLEDLDDRSYNSKGKMTHFIVAKKYD